MRCILLTCGCVPIDEAETAPIGAKSGDAVAAHLPVCTYPFEWYQAVTGKARLFGMYSMFRANPSPCTMMFHFESLRMNSSNLSVSRRTEPGVDRSQTWRCCDWRQGGKARIRSAATAIFALLHRCTSLLQYALSGLRVYGIRCRTEDGEARTREQ